VITKSGSTLETLAQLLIMRKWLRVSQGQGAVRSRMAFVTDPKKGLLRELAAAEGIRTFEIPENVAGRYSVLSPVGLLPAAFLGIEIGKVLDGAASMAARVSDDDVLQNPACLFAAGSILAHRELGRSSLVMMPYSDALQETAEWFVQLWAESLGRRFNRHGEIVRAGQTPIAAVGATDQHAELQLFIEGPADKAVAIVSVESHRHRLEIPAELEGRSEVAYLRGRDLSELLHAERRATRAALLDGGVPVLDVSIPQVDEASIGGLLLLLQAASACAGIVVGVNPFEPPGLQTSRQMTLGLLGDPEFAQMAARVRARESEGEGGRSG
jgi:glucose-6-phosphate isomerase